MTEKDLIKLYAKRVRELRVARKLSVYEMAEKSGIKPQWIYRAETEYFPPTLKKLVQLAKFFSVKVSYFFEEDKR